jgi:DNA-binding beta-propeller fold protein YncE
VFFTKSGVVEGRRSTVMRVAQKGGRAAPIASKELGPFAVAAGDQGVYWLAQGTSCSGSNTDGALRSAPFKGGTAREVASGLACPEGLVIRGGFAYVTSTADGRVVRISLAGGESTNIASGEHMPRSIAVDDERVYWIAFHDESLRAAPVGGGRAVTLVGKGASGGVAVDTSGVYATNTSSGTVIFIPASERHP